MSVKRYTNGADDDQGTILPFMEESSEGEYVEYSDYAALLAEVEELKRMLEASTFGIEFAKEDIKKLEAEVERLTERNKFLEQIDSYLQGANEHAYEKRCDELEAEVERLRKAGDAMADAIKWLPQTISDHHQQAWLAAKEGKQS